MNKKLIFFSTAFALILLILSGGCQGNGDVISGAIGTAADLASQTQTVEIQADQNATNGADSSAPATQPTPTDEFSPEEVEQMLATEEFHYTSTRDPYRSPLEQLEKSNLLNPKDAILEGVISGPRGLLAIVRSLEGKHWLLREGDRVSGGNVAEITPEAVTFVFETYGSISKVVITRQSSTTEEGQ